MGELTKTPLEIKETRRSGGGAQIEFLPFEHEDLGLRIYKKTEFPKTASSVEMAEAMGGSYSLRWALAECLLSFNLPQDVQEATPGILGIGLYIPDEEGSFYFEASRETMEGEGVYEALSYTYGEGAELASRGIGSSIFTLVEKVPMAEWGDERPDVFYSPRALVKFDPEAYRQGLINGLKFYRAARNFGMWNFDIKNKDPFICDRQGNVRVIDTSGFQALSHGKAGEFMRAFYEQEMSMLEEKIRAEVIGSEPDPLTPEEREEYDRLSEEIEELAEKGQEALTTLEVDEKIARYGEVERKLETKENEFVWELRRRESAKKRLSELQERKAETQRQKKLKLQAEEIDGKIQAAEKRLGEARKPFQRLSAIEELRELAAEVIARGTDDVDAETRRKLIDLEFKSGIRNSHSYKKVAYCRDVLTEVETLEEEKPLDERKNEAQRQVAEAEAELEKLRTERQALGKVPARVFEPSDYSIASVEKEIAKLKTADEVQLLRGEIASVREIIEQIKKHRALDSRVKYSRDKSQSKATDLIEFKKRILFEEELPKSTNKRLTQANVGQLLRECGFETFLDTANAAELEELREFYNQVRGGRYPVDDPRIVIDIFITQLNKVKVKQEEV